MISVALSHGIHLGGAGMNNNRFTIEIYNGISKGPVEILSPVRLSVALSFISDWLSNATYTDSLPFGYKISITKTKEDIR